MHIQRSSALLLIYSTAHFVVDACCAATVFATVAPSELSAGRIAALFLVYNSLAFGLESPFGLVVDALQKPRLAAILGCLLCASAFLLTSMPAVTAIVAGIGNALFHVGGGSICLQATPQRATGPGFFVAPGSAGLLFGSVLGRQGLGMSLFLIPIALVVCWGMACTAVPSVIRSTGTPKTVGRIDLVVALLLLPIVVRTMLESIVHFPWATQPGLLIGLTAALVLGKAIGGMLGDRWGWMQVGIGSLLVSLPFLVCAPVNHLAALPGVFFLSVSTSITLAAIAEVLPGRPAFAFGMTCTAILLGLFPAMLGQSSDKPFFVSLIILLSIISLYWGLRPTSRNDVSAEPCRSKNEMA
jgi:FSR family fosmidomycin resistance protein-like MFS transporter